MEDEKPLDYIHKIENRGFSKSAFHMFLISFSCLLIFILISFFTPSREFFDVIIMIFTLGFIVTNIIGFIYTIRSFLNKESNSIYKTIGAIGNILLFIAVLSIIWALIMDLAIWF